MCNFGELFCFCIWCCGCCGCYGKICSSAAVSNTRQKCFKYFSLIKSLQQEFEFLKLVNSFGNGANNKKNIETKCCKTSIIILNIIFISLIIIDLILTNFYSFHPFPLFTVSVSTIKWFNNSSLTIYIMLFFSILAIFSTLFSCCYHCHLKWQQQIDEYEESDNSMSFPCIPYCGYPTCMGPLYFVVHYILAALYLIIIFVLFCVSPPLLLYIICIIYQLANRPHISLLYNEQYINQHPCGDIIDTINIISDRHINYGLIHRRLAQYILAYIIWPIRNSNYNKTQKLIINKIKQLLQMDINNALKILQTESTYDKNVYSQFIEDYKHKNIKNVSTLMDKTRFKSYVIGSVILYIIFGGKFWLSCYLTEFYINNVNDENRRILIIFYTISYVLYFVILYSIAWIYWIEFKSLVKHKYEWILCIYSNKGKYKFKQKYFIKLYCIICYQYVIYQTLNCVFKGNNQWMVRFIMQYLMKIDAVHNIENIIDLVYGNKNKLEQFTFTRYWKDPLHNVRDIKDEQYHTHDVTVHWRNCVQIQNEQLIRSVTKPINISYELLEKEYCYNKETMFCEKGYSTSNSYSIYS